MKKFMNRIVRASLLDAALYKEAVSDKKTMSQAVGVVVLAGLAAGLAVAAQGGVIALLVAIAASLLGWYIWAFMIYFLGTRLMPGPQTQADLGQLLRAVGFSSAPGIVRIFGIIYAIQNPVFMGASIWMLAAMIIAAREALNYKSTLRAIGVCAVGWIIQAAVLAALFSVMGGGDLLKGISKDAAPEDKPAAQQQETQTNTDSLTQ